MHKSSEVIHTSVLAAVVNLLAGCGQSHVNGSIPPTSIVRTSSIADTSDVRNLMAMSTHVFAGRVESETGSKALDSIPETQFRVSTGTALKGDVPESAIVNQQGGMADGVYISVNGDVPLTVGQWYLFAARVLAAENWYTVIPVDGDKPITEQQARDTESPPLAEAIAAMKANPENRLFSVSEPEPSLTFPLPKPGDYNPPP